MLRLLCGFACVVLASGAALSNGETITFRTCPVGFFGSVFTQIQVTFGNTQKYSFDNNNYLEFPDYQGQTVEFTVLTDSNDLRQVISLVTAERTELTVMPTCLLKFSWIAQDKAMGFYLMSFGKVPLIFTQSLTSENRGIFKIIANQQTFASITLGMTPEQGATLLTGCVDSRYGFHQVSSTSDYPPTCSSIICTETGYTEVYKCSSSQVCSRGECTDVCVVTGNTIIDTSGVGGQVTNFCGRKLLSGSLTVEAFYDERRLSDVPFLDSVVVKSGKKLTLKQGGVVLNDDDEIIDLSSGSASQESVTITKKDDGVLVTVGETLIFFDGTTLHIMMTGPSVQGMCADATTTVPADIKVSGCDSIQQDPRGDNINCEAVMSRCDRLVSSYGFEDCSLNKAEYSKACSNLLCNYPDKDGLVCELLNALARTCQTSGWREAAGCPITGCHQQDCLGEEFCGLSGGGEPRCFCRYSTSAPLRADNKLGPDPVCSDNEASLSLLGCLLAEDGVDPTALTLKDPACGGSHASDKNTYTFTFSDSGTCDASVQVVGNQIVYSNVVHLPSSDGMITRDDQFSVTFSCAFSQPETETLTLKIKASSVIHTIASKEWEYVLEMEAFSDAAMTNLVSDTTDLTLDQMLWVKVRALEVGGTLLSVVIESCWATKEEDAEADDKYMLIEDGCSTEDTTEMLSNGESLSSAFSFRVFQFTGSEADVHLHCKTKLCIVSEGCTKTCG